MASALRRIEDGLARFRRRGAPVNLSAVLDDIAFELDRVYVQPAQHMVLEITRRGVARSASELRQRRRRLPLLDELGAHMGQRLLQGADRSAPAPHCP
ncbi:MAG: hypothetical protein R3D05_05470 [Dongiaceae bacterium]